MSRHRVRKPVWVCPRCRCRDGRSHVLCAMLDDGWTARLEDGRVVLEHPDGRSYVLPDPDSLYRAAVLRIPVSHASPEAGPGDEVPAAGPADDRHGPEDVGHTAEDGPEARALGGPSRAPERTPKEAGSPLHPFPPSSKKVVRVEEAKIEYDRGPHP